MPISSDEVFGEKLPAWVDEERGEGVKACIIWSLASIHPMGTKFILRNHLVYW